MCWTISFAGSPDMMEPCCHQEVARFAECYLWNESGWLSLPVYSLYAKLSEGAAGGSFVFTRQTWFNGLSLLMSNKLKS